MIMDNSSYQREKEKSALLEKKVIYHGKRLNFYLEKAIYPSKKSKTFELIDHPQAVLINPVSSSDKIIFVKQYRKAVDNILIELPAGLIEKNESPSSAAQRELQEEIGYKADQLIDFGGIYTSPGFCNEYIHLFIAKDLKKSYLAPDEDENIDIIEYSLSEALDLIKNNKILDSKTIVSILKYKML